MTSTFKLPDFPKFDLSKFELPKFDLPKFDLSKIDLPKFDLPKLDDNVTAALRDAAYITVGLGVTAVERAAARRRQLIEGINERVEAGKAQAETLVGAVEARLTRFDERVRGLLRNAA